MNLQFGTRFHIQVDPRVKDTSAQEIAKELQKKLALKRKQLGMAPFRYPLEVHYLLNNKGITSQILKGPGRNTRVVKTATALTEVDRNKKVAEALLGHLTLIQVLAKSFLASLKTDKPRDFTITRKSIASLQKAARTGAFQDEFHITVKKFKNKKA